MQKYKILKKLQEFKAGNSPVVTYEVELPNGKKGQFYRREGRDIATVIPLIDDKTVVMARQYRFGGDVVSLEFPKGRVDEGETVEKTAARELIEETGYEGKHFTPLGYFHVSAAWNSQKEYIFVAENLHKGPQRLEADEFIEVVIIALSDVPKLIKSGEISDVGTIAAYHLLTQMR